MRMWGGLCSILLQFLIIITGNYAFFNLLTLALIASLFDNHYLQWISPDLLHFQAFSPQPILSVLLSLIGAMMIALNGIALIRQFIPLNMFERLLAQLSHLMLLNTYGLFAMMTTTRDELIIEGSLDGMDWQEYSFKYKPQSLYQAPQQIAPLHPRLDWQCWFAPLSPRYAEWWMSLLLKRLLEHSPEVLNLFASYPFSTAPTYVRVECYRYHFSSLKEWREHSSYWTRTYQGHFIFPISLRDFQ